MKVYQTELNKYIEMDVIGKVKYIGENQGISLINGKEYNVVGIEKDFIRVVDETEEDFLRKINNPCSLMHPEEKGEWIVVEDKTGELQKAFDKYKL